MPRGLTWTEPLFICKILELKNIFEMNVKSQKAPALSAGPGSGLETKKN
jgi:hypothetical protein